jgi:hypothetical protein
MTKQNLEGLAVYIPPFAAQRMGHPGGGRNKGEKQIPFGNDNKIGGLEVYIPPIRCAEGWAPERSLLFLLGG